MDGIPGDPVAAAECRHGRRHVPARRRARGVRYRQEVPSHFPGAARPRWIPLGRTARRRRCTASSNGACGSISHRGAAPPRRPPHAGGFRRRRRRCVSSCRIARATRRSWPRARSTRRPDVPVPVREDVVEYHLCRYGSKKRCVGHRRRQPPFAGGTTKKPPCFCS